jgi:hypothetical protein
VVNFIIHKCYRTHFTVLKRTREFHATGLRIELHKFCYVTKLQRRNVLQGARKELLGAEEQGLHWHNGKRLDEGDIV